MDIKREYYLDKMKTLENNGRIKVITGMRRCGKSHFLFQLFQKDLLVRGVDRDHIVAISFGNTFGEKLREPITLYSYIKSQIRDEKPYYVLLDEVHFVERFFEVLSSFLRIENMDIYITDSNLKFLTSDILLHLGDRGEEVRLYPLSFAEYVIGYEGTKEQAFSDYVTFGGLPEILSMKTDQQKKKYLSDLFQEICSNQIIKQYDLRNTSKFESSIKVLASACGTLTNSTKLANTLKKNMQSGVSDKTIKLYMEYLQEAFLTELVARYDIRRKKYSNTPIKFYFLDLGLRNAGLFFSKQDKKSLMENAIYNELRTRGYQVDVGFVEIRETDESGKRSRKQLEVDFIAQKGIRKCYIQWVPVGDKELEEQKRQNLNCIGDSFKKLILVGDSMEAEIDHMGIVTLGIFDFLSQTNSLDIL